MNFPALILSETEHQLFEVLQEAAARSDTIVRIAGGWVRDKLLGLHSDDIDVGRMGTNSVLLLLTLT